MGIGIIFEEEFCDRLSELLPPTCYRKSSQEEDFLYGADCYVYGLPVDVTIGNRKDHVEWFREISLNLSRVVLGRREGNGVINFDDSVLVVFVQPCVPLNDTGRRFVLDELSNLEFIDDLMDSYWEFVDEQELA